MTTPVITSTRADLARALGAGLIAAFVGFASSFAVVLQGLRAVGADQAEAAGGLAALSVAMGVCGIVLSLRYRMPISVAWSTPGAALLAGSSAGGGFGSAVGAFLLAGVLTVVAGLWRPFGRWVSAIPAPLSGAMLAGVLLPLCLAPARAVVATPLLGVAVVLAWALAGAFRKRYATPAAALAAVLAIAVTSHRTDGPPVLVAPHPVLVAPHWSLGATLGIGLPLFLVTMASQNVPGLAVLRANGYRPPTAPLLRWTGVFSLGCAPLGGHGVNLAAITAALCAGEEAGTDPRRRYWAGVTCGVGYLFFGVAASAVVAFVDAAPPTLIEAVAGLALLGALGNSLLGAIAEPDHREAAVVTLVVTASGVSFFGINGAFWGLLAGGTLYLLGRLRKAKIS